MKTKILKLLGCSKKLNFKNKHNHHLFKFQFTSILILTFISFYHIGYSQQLISNNSIWKYYDAGNVNNITWIQPTFNDSSWPQGSSELGYGDSDESTIIGYGGNSANKHITAYFRKSFNLTAKTNLNCSIKFDDGVVIYLNGIEIYRNFMPNGLISYNTLAIGGVNENIFYNLNIDLENTQVGTNVLAIEVHQGSPNSSDLSFSFNLFADVPPPPTGIYINEIVSSNNNSFIDNNGKSPDWVEILNNTADTLDLANYYISDSKTNLLKYRFQSTPNIVFIAPLKHKIFTSNATFDAVQGQFPFSFSSNGEFFSLVAPDGITIIDSLSFPKLPSDVSFGRLYTNIDSLVYFSPSSPNFKNLNTNGFMGISNPPELSHLSNLYSSDFQISNLNDSGNTYYSLNGADPTVESVIPKSFNFINQYPELPYQSSGPTLTHQYQSYLYNLPINTNFNFNTTANYAKINTMYLNNPPFLKSSIEKIRVMKFRNISNGFMPSETQSRSFLIQNRTYTLPVLSIQINPESYFDINKGIGVAGKDFINFKNANPGLTANFQHPANYWRDSTVKGSATFFENNKVRFNRNFDFKISGRGSRRYWIKTLTISTDNSGNSEFPDSLFIEKPNQKSTKLILRNAGNDVGGSFCKDAAIHVICSNLRYERQRYRPVTLFLNGEYWGISNLRDKMDDDMISLKYNLSKDSLELLEESELQSPILGQDYRNLANYIRTNNMATNTNYEYVKSKLDIPSFIDWSITQSFFGNSDKIWGNYGIWRYRGNSTPNTIKDGKFRWYLFDLDLAFDTTATPFQSLKYDGNIEEGYPYYYQYLKNNIEFKNEFINRYADLLNSNFSNIHTNTIIDSIKTTLNDEMTHHIARWTIPANQSTWLANINYLKTFCNNRMSFIYDSTNVEFGLTGTINISLETDNLSHGSIKINTLLLKNGEPGIPNNPIIWTGKYFKSIPISISTVANPGYRFKHWIHNGIINTDPEIIINSTINESYKAFFEIIIISDNPSPLAKNIINCGYEFTNWSPLSIGGTFPPNTDFVYFNSIDPVLTANLEGKTSGVYNFTSRTRINGLGNLGISFINTSGSNFNPGYETGKLGGMLIALNTIGVDSVKISWKARTIQPGFRKYALRLQYREGDLLQFNDFTSPIVYQGSTVSNDSMHFENIILPAELLNKPYVQLLWRYYYTGVGTSGSRDRLAIDDIKIKTTQKQLLNINNATLIIEQPNTAYWSNKIENNSNVKLKVSNSILLEPGFLVDTDSVFLAEVEGCIN